jgi:hypothetical protein
LLALLVLGEVKHGRYGVFIADLVEEQGLLFFETHMKEVPKILGAILGKEFLKWVMLKSKMTTDEMFHMCIHYL